MVIPSRSPFLEDDIFLKEISLSGFSFEYLSFAEEIQRSGISIMQVCLFSFFSKNFLFFSFKFFFLFFSFFLFLFLFSFSFSFSFRILRQLGVRQSLVLQGREWS